MNNFEIQHYKYFADIWDIWNRFGEDTIKYHYIVVVFELTAKCLEQLYIIYILLIDEEFTWSVGNNLNGAMRWIYHI